MIRHRFRYELIALWTLLAVVLSLLALTIEDLWPKALVLLNFPWADNAWSDGPHLVALLRMDHGGAAYTAPRSLNSLDDGPAYLFILFAIRHLFGLPAGVLAYRAISTLLGLGAVLPLCASALIIARAAGIARTGWLPLLGVAGPAALFALADLSRSPALQALDPDALAILIICAALATYYALATRMVDARAVWLVVALCALATFTRQSTFAIYPILAAGLLLGGIISPRLAGASALAFGAIVLLGIVAMPGDMRAWTVQVPLSHQYEFGQSGRFGGFLHSFFGQYFLIAQCVAAGLVAWALALRGGRGAYFVHGAAGLAVVACSAAAYFAPFGGQNDLTLIAMFSAPYCAALVGLLGTPRFVKRAQAGIVVGAIVTLMFAAQGLLDAPGVSPPDIFSDSMSDAARAVLQVCAHDTVTVTAFPGMLLDCPNARYALLPSYYELSAARDGFDPGLTVFDRPDSSSYVVDLAGWPIPQAWQQTHRLEREFPVRVASGDGFVADTLRIWSR